MSSIEVTLLWKGDGVFLPSNIEEQVFWLSKELMHQAVPEHYQRGVFSQMTQLNTCIISAPTKICLDPVFSRTWDKSCVFLEIPGPFVMCIVGDSPTVEWNKKERMYEQAHRPI
jgi:hypothetical protein